MHWSPYQYHTWPETTLCLKHDLYLDPCIRCVDFNAVFISKWNPYPLPGVEGMTFSLMYKSCRGDWGYHSPLNFNLFSSDLPKFMVMAAICKMVVPDLLAPITLALSEIHAKSTVESLSHFPNHSKKSFRSWQEYFSVRRAGRGLAGTSAQLRFAGRYATSGIGEEGEYARELTKFYNNPCSLRIVANKT